jgi:hypothetical protein
MYYFIGEKRSEQAIKNNWHWEDNVSTAKFLLDCLKELGIEQKDIKFYNLWFDDGQLDDILLDGLYYMSNNYSKCIVVGMGNTVCNKLDEKEVKYIKIIHPAARGKIRKKENYIAHLKERLGWSVAVEYVMKEHEEAWKQLALL